MSTLARRRTGLAVLVLAYLAFVSLGLPDGLLGVAWPSISAGLTVPTEAVGLLLTSATVGYLVSSVVAGFSIARIGVGWLLAGSTALAGLALAGYAGSPALPVMIGAALLLGLGSGAIDAGLNAYAAGAFGPRQMNWLHACFGLGVAIGPLVMTSAIAGGLGWRWGYGIVAVAQAGLALAFLLTVRIWDRGRATDPADPAGKPASPPVRISATLALPEVWFGMLTFGVYVAIEVGAGLWAFLLLTEDRGIGATTAGLCVSLYWGSLFVGRVIQGLVAERIGSRTVLLGSMYAMLAGSALVAVPGPGWLAVAGLAVIGLGAAAVFPLLTLSTAERVGQQHADRTIGLQIGASGLGGALIPGGLGVLIGRSSVAVLGPALVLLSAAMIALYWASNRRAARRPVPAG